MLNPQDVLTLKDPGTLEIQVSQGLPPEGQMHIINSVDAFEAESKWEVAHTDEGLVIVVEDGDLNVMWTPDDFVSGTHSDLQENECDWMFINKEPVEEIVVSNDDCEYLFEFRSTKYSTRGDEFISVHEWFCENTENPNPKILCVEFGDYINYFQGAGIKTSDYTLMKAKA